MYRDPGRSKVSGASALVCWVFVLALAAAPLSAQELGRQHQAELINDISQGLREIYVFPAVAAEMEALLQRRFEGGDYDGLGSLAEFTGQLTEDLQSISHDLHLRVRPHAAWGEEGRRDAAEESRQQREQARLTNYGFYRVERLSGNIGYLDLRSFHDAELAGATAVAAMNFLANSSALIIDLRQNGGGSPSMIQLISSYFFEERKHLNTFYYRRANSYEEFWTHSKVQGPKMVGAPLYILTSGRTFSAAEEFTYNLKHMKRATIIGETTGGGAHPVDFLISDMGDGFYASISMPFGRAINPITETNWEGTGVKPHIEVPAADALDHAHREALAEVASRSAGVRSRDAGSRSGAVRAGCSRTCTAQRVAHQ